MSKVNEASFNELAKQSNERRSRERPNNVKKIILKDLGKFNGVVEW